MASNDKSPLRPSLRTHYLNYIAELNAHHTSSSPSTWQPNLSPFVSSSLAYNNQPLTRDQYTSIIASSVTQFPDLRYVPVSLVVEEDDDDGDDDEPKNGKVAARLEFVCTPKEEYKGVPGGTKIRFYEHVFYDFEDLRITRVNALFSEVEVVV
ncbi:hypothetical protein AJ80_02569 [Polytolypa hystricis UAMH7299]|uniref:SnoaL-like domain-containing protein n=1 Tax=Polytolypa hystricis (strain UAMH7299) TaxID=1447883 RepID=A0A2B7YRS5_POLH7|nr:hypothetical protein AJ80_02569 [Polytolypa hystricis UAMH7299]